MDLGLRFVTIAAEVECTMEDDPVKFNRDGLAERFSIVPDPVDTDINFSLNGLVPSTQRKCDYISQEIMMEELPVDRQELVIGTKDIVELLKGHFLFFEYGYKKITKPDPVFKRVWFLKEELYTWINHISKFVNKAGNTMVVLRQYYK